MRVAVLLSAIVAAVSGCARPSAQLVLMRYDDFGPQAAVYEWLGNDWWQWQDEGGPNREQQYDIQVVVYRNCTLAEVRRRYPSSRARHKDYRYVTYEEAKRRLDALIEEDALPALTEQLAATRAALQRKFE